MYAAAVSRNAIRFTLVKPPKNLQAIASPESRGLTVYEYRQNALSGVFFVKLITY